MSFYLYISSNFVMCFIIFIICLFLYFYIALTYLSRQRFIFILFYFYLHFLFISASFQLQKKKIVRINSWLINDNKTGPMLFQTSLTFIVWTKAEETFLNIYFVQHKKVI